VHRGAVRAGGKRYCGKIKLKSYPLVERGGVLWTHMGAKDAVPPLPEWEFAAVADRQRFVSKRLQESTGCSHGGRIDSSTCRSCTAATSTPTRCSRRKGNQYNLADSRPVFEVVESAGGLFIGARRNARTTGITGASPSG